MDCWTRVPRLRLRLRARTLVRMAAVATIAATASLMTPVDGEASTFVWKNNSDGDWNVPANWTRTSGEPGDGFPNRPGDDANFPSKFNAPRTITIPAGVVITVGTIGVFGNTEVTIEGAGARLAFETPPGGGGALIRDFGAAGALNLNVPVTLRVPATVFTAINTTVRCQAIDEFPATLSRSVTKAGPGSLVFRAPTEYTGTTKVDEGALVLEGTLGPIVRTLEIGDGNGERESAVVYSTADNQIAPYVVEVNKDGALNLTGSTRVGALVMRDGVIRVGSLHRLTMAGLTMTGGVLWADEGAALILEGDVTATSSALGPALIFSDNSGALELNAPGATRTFTVTDGPSPVDLEVRLAVTGADAGLTKDGAGTLQFSGGYANKYGGTTIVRQGQLDLAHLNDYVSVPHDLQIGVGAGPAVVYERERHNIYRKAALTIGAGGTLLSNVDQQVESVTITTGGRVTIGEAETRAGWMTFSFLSMTGGRLTLGAESRFHIAGNLSATSTTTEAAVIDGPGSTGFQDNGHQLVVADGPQAIDLQIGARLFRSSSPTSGPIIKRGPGVVQLMANGGDLRGTVVEQGKILVTSAHTGDAFSLAGGTLGGTGTVGAVTTTASGGTVAPGLSPGRFTTGALALTPAAVLAIELNGAAPGATYDQLDVRGTVSLGGATLLLSAAGFTPSAAAKFIIIANDGTDTVTDTFAGLPEGATVSVGSKTLTISYRGGDGNDVVLTNPEEEETLTYFLAEGATGAFFDDDVLIANPNDTEAPVTMTFLKEGGTTVVEHRTIPAQSRVTVHVDQIAGLEEASASVQVASDKRLPLIVERSMFWDQSYYGGHTANAVAKPETRWIFAEGFQGFFDTYILLANANDTETTATLTFLREGDTPFVTTVPVGPFARKTVYAGDYPEIAGRAFGIVVDSSLPVIAERSMYFATLPGKLWSGGHVNTGIVSPSTSWFHAEGATGSYFSTFILLSNPQDNDAHVELRFLLDTGDVITRTKTIGAKQRVTINPAIEGDARLESAALSTVVQSDVPIVSERSMYWAADATPFGEGHNSSGLISTATRWGLAEGRVGGPRGFDTYILLANPSTTAAEVRVTYLPEGAPPIVKTYTVSATSRFNIDVKTVVPELKDASFGARIEVTNDVAIAVERSLYWNANNVSWAGGTNALATPIP
jgi:autotransporter-associated beta strand protein